MQPSRRSGSRRSTTIGAIAASARPSPSNTTCRGASPTSRSSMSTLPATAASFLRITSMTACCSTTRPAARCFATRPSSGATPCGCWRSRPRPTRCSRPTRRRPSKGPRASRPLFFVRCGRDARGPILAASLHPCHLTVMLPLTVLGIETSCDETAVAVVGEGREIRTNIVLSQLDEHAPYGGVVPEIAARAHLDHVDGLVRRALDEAGIGLGEIDAVAASAGPGLIGGLLVGTMAGKGIAWAAGKPYIAVNHLEAHALTARLSGDVLFPYLLLLVSGGHSQLL